MFNYWKIIKVQLSKILFFHDILLKIGYNTERDLGPRRSFHVSYRIKHIFRAMCCSDREIKMGCRDRLHNCYLHVVVFLTFLQYRGTFYEINNNKKIILRHYSIYIFLICNYFKTKKKVYVFWEKSKKKKLGWSVKIC